MTVILVSNRVAEPNSDGPIEGGLASALLQAVRVSGAVWVGTRVHQSSPDRKEPLTALATVGAGTTARVDLPVGLYHKFYRGFANSALWPALHSRPDLIRADHDDYAAYREVNRMIALALRRLVQADAPIWVHDYHFLTLAAELRRAGWKARSASSCIHRFRARSASSACRITAISCEAMLAYDLIGFQTDDDLSPISPTTSRRAGTGGGRRKPRCRYRMPRASASFPIGIDVKAFAEGALRAVARPDIARLRASLQASKLAIGVDRLDYSKGLANRLRAFDRMLATDRSLKRATFAPADRRAVARRHPAYGSCAADWRHW